MNIVDKATQTQLADIKKAAEKHWRI